MRPLWVLLIATSLPQNPKQNVCHRVVIQGEPRVEKLESSPSSLVQTFSFFSNSLIIKPH